MISGRTWTKLQKFWFKKNFLKQDGSAPIQEILDLLLCNLGEWKYVVHLYISEFKIKTKRAVVEDELDG